MTHSLDSDDGPMAIVQNTGKRCASLFRLGDFYEAFHDDAKMISKELGLTLTQRQGVPMCGVPFHAHEQYVDKLIAKGHKIAIAEQTEDPKTAKGLVKREISRICHSGNDCQFAAISTKKRTITSRRYRRDRLDLRPRFSRFDNGRVPRPGTGERGGSHRRAAPHPSRRNSSRPRKFKQNHPSFFQELSYCRFLFFSMSGKSGSFRCVDALKALLDHFQVQSLDGFGIEGSKCRDHGGRLPSHLFQRRSCLRLNHVRTIQNEALGAVYGHRPLDHAQSRDHRSR